MHGRATHEWITFDVGRDGRSVYVRRGRTRRPAVIDRYTPLALDAAVIFYRATRIHSADYAVARCPSVTRRYCV